MTHPGCYLGDLSKTLNFFCSSETVKAEFFFFSNNLDRQCPLPKSFSSVDKYALKEIIHFTF